MVKKLLALALVLAMTATMAVVKYEKINKKIAQRINDTGNQSKAVTWTGTLGSTFDKGSNGAGWYMSYNRKIQTNMVPGSELTPMIGTIHRQLSSIGTGVIGGMVGNWDTTTFNGFAQSIYESSLYSEGGIPGGRFPYTCEFINGYVFGIFSDYNVPVATNSSQAMFSVADATYGWEESYWSEPTRAEAVESGATPPGAWQGIGDVVYNPNDGYYYWAHNWVYENVGIDTYTYMMTGRSNDVMNPSSWEWTDYHELTFDTKDDPNYILQLSDLSISYSKDIYGNGTGYGIAVAMFTDRDVITNLAGDTLDVIDRPKLGYMYTTNWGADWGTGDFKSNWITPNNEGTTLFTADINKLIDWYGSIVSGDSIGVDGDGNPIYEETPMNWPYWTWNISSVSTEENIVHVMMKGKGGTTESDYVYTLNDEKVIVGYYDVVGEITPSGVNWLAVNYIATPMGVADDTQEWMYSNTNDFTIGYAGKGALYANWLDRPETRYSLVLDQYPGFTNENKTYINDAFFTYSADNGKTWDINKTYLPTDWPAGYEMKYAANITKTSTMDHGFTVATHGYNANGTLNVFGACQYIDYANPAAPPLDSFTSYQQFYKAWKITGTPTGIETEEVSMEKDFTLMQNYPNPFNPSTEIKFALQNDADVKLTVYNTKGELVSNLKNEKMVKGSHAVNFDASALNSGVYFYKLSVNGITEAKKMVLTK